jgi:hypothetical protein
MNVKDLKSLYETYMSVYADSEKTKVTTECVSENDTYDLVLEYLLNEGFADTEENALVIMQNMSGAWKESILEAHRN